MNEVWNPDELYHHGIKGQKWGVRRFENYDGKLTNAGKARYSLGGRNNALNDRNPNYTNQQRRRDQQVYSKGAVKRINRAMNEGDSVSTARSREAERINNTREIARTAGSVGRTVGKVAGAVGGYILADKLLRQYGGSAFNDPNMRMMASGAIASGAMSVSSQLGGAMGTSVVMLAGGYSPTKYR